MRRALAAFVLLAASAAAAAPSGVETLRRDVQRALKLRTSAERASAVQRAFAEQDSAEAAQVAVDEVFDKDEGQTVIEATMLAVARMQSPLVVVALRKGADGAQPLRRIRSIEAIGRSQAPGSAGALLALMADSDATIRAAAATAVGGKGDATVVGNVEALLADPAWNVRSAAAAALARLGSRASVPALCAAMRKADGRFVDDCAFALADVTGQRFGADPGRYETWWAKTASRTTSAAAPWEAPPLSFKSARVATRSQRILFVLATSDTMKDAVADAASDERAAAAIREAGADLADDLKSAKTKLDVARVHLRSMLRTLRDGVNFDVMVYSGSPSFAFGRLTPADAATRKRAETRIASLSPGGQGNLHGALLRAFDEKGKDPYVVTDGPDTIVLFSDGALSAPGSTDAAEVAGAVTRWEAVRQVRMLVFETGQSEDAVLGRLAFGPPPGATLSLP